MDPQVKISVVIGSYNRKRFFQLALDSIRKELVDFSHEIIAVDGGSTDGTLNWLLKQKDIITVVQHNRGFWQGKPIKRKSWGYFMNLGFKAAQGKYICMLSDDCLVVPGAIKNGYQLFEEKLQKGEKVGAMAFYFRNWPEQKDYFVGLTLGGKMMVNHGLYLKAAMEEVGYVDEELYMFYCADGDLCLRMWQKGYVCVDSPNSFIEHHTHANKMVRRTNSALQDEDIKNYQIKWARIFPQAEANLSDGAIYKKFNDPNHTVDQFKKLKINYLTTKIFSFLEHNQKFMDLYCAWKAKKTH